MPVLWFLVGLLVTVVALRVIATLLPGLTIDDWTSALMATLVIEVAFCCSRLN